MENLITDNVWINAAIILGMRVINMALDTLRLRMMARGQKALTFIFGVIETLIFVYVLGSVVQNLDNWVNTIAYALGFGIGSLVGMALDERLAVGYTHIRVISPGRGALLAETLRERGFAVTEFAGRGRDGTVTMLSVSVKRKNSKNVRALVEELDENAFITAEDLTPVRRGYWGR
ncbi:MAG: DUF2179 domain-containing protein [Anaerolineales bacterium]|nr:DUF2179 domain-containing protein [Anaerolineales bacterium]